MSKGQHGYQILAPNRRAARVATDAGGHSRALGADEAPSADESLETQRVLKGFRIEHVFAAEQTTGEPLTEPPMPKVLDGQAPDGLWDNIIGQITDRGYAVCMVPSADARSWPTAQRARHQRTGPPPCWRHACMGMNQPVMAALNWDVDSGWRAAG